MNHPVTSRELRLEGFDSDRLAEVLAGSRLEHYLLGRARCHVLHRHWECGGISIDQGHYSFPVRVLGGFPSDRYSLGYMRRQLATTRVNGIGVSWNTLEFYPPGAELDYRTFDAAEWLAISFHEEDLQKAAIRRLGMGLALPHRSMMSLTVPAGWKNALDRAVMRMMTKTMIDEPGTPMRFLEQLAALLGDLLDREGDGASRQIRMRAEIISKADVHLRRSVGRPFDAKALAAATGTTPRTVQRHFMDELGVTPREWARCLALHCARKRLTAEKPDWDTLESLARDIGFGNPGRFAGYYRSLFGECPHATMNRRRPDERA